MPPRTGYSYIRFSAKKQEKGDSIRRQTKMRDDWLARHPDTTLDESVKADLGRSAFKGKKQKELLAFIDRIEAGDVKPGSVLIVEALDRVSRQGVDEGYDLLKRILRAGVSIVTLAPEREYGPDAIKGLMKGALELQFLLEAAERYSQTISERVAESYQGRRDRVRRREAAAVGAMLPAWCVLVAGTGGKGAGKPLVGAKIVLDRKKADAVRRVFELAAAGYGATQIVRKLTEEHVLAIARRARWNVGYVLKLIRDRRVLGEYQPTAGGKEDGPPIPDYFPRVVEDQLWQRARAGAEERTSERFRGRPAKDGTVNLFPGLIKNALTGDTMVLRSNSNSSGPRTYVLVDGGLGHNRWNSFPYPPFERLVRSQLVELDPAKVIGTATTGDGAELLALEDERGEVKARLSEIVAELSSRGNKKVGALAIAADQLEERERELTETIAKLRGKVARPLLPAWQEAHALLAAREEGPGREDVRVRLRDALRNIVSEVSMLVVARNLERFAAVQFDFHEGGRRQYLLYHRRQYYNFRATVPAIERGLSFREARLPEALDLLDREQAGELEAALIAVEWPEA